MFSRSFLRPARQLGSVNTPMFPCQRCLNRFLPRGAGQPISSLFADFLHLQQARRYATDPPKSSNNFMLYGGVAAAAAGVAASFFFYPGTPTPQQAVKEAKNKTLSAANLADAPKTFTGGEQGFVGLVLDQVEELNHNTKKFRFKLTDQNAVTGLHVACMEEQCVHLQSSY